MPWAARRTGATRPEETGLMPLQSARMIPSIQLTTVEDSMKRLLAAAASALIAIAGVPTADADIIEVCRAKRGGMLYWPLGMSEGKCRKGDMALKVESPMGGAANVEGTGVIATFLDGAVDLIAERHLSVAQDPEHGEPCSMWVETDPDVRMLRLSDSDWSNAGTWLDRHMDEVEAQRSEAPLPFQRSLLAQLLQPRFAASGGRQEFITEDGFHLVIKDVLLTWDMGDKSGCYGRATVSGRQR